MLTLEQIQDLLKNRRLSVVAEKTGLSRMTIWRVREGKGVQISYDVVKRLSDYLTGANDAH